MTGSPAPDAEQSVVKARVAPDWRCGRLIRHDEDK